MSIDGSRRVVATAFVLLLALSVVWPEPVVDINHVCCNLNLGVDELSFLGREAPSWDVVFWCITGLFLLALLQPGADLPSIRQELREIQFRRSWRLLIFSLLCAIVVALIWRWIDTPLMAWSESLEGPGIDDTIRLANRFGGGMNPVMIIGFFLLAGAVYRARHWMWCGVAMAIAGAAAGIFVQIVKFVVGRTRPELWLGPFHHARASASSFPSGHTVGAFALAGVLMLHARSKGLRVVAALLALAVAVSRVLAFRHWPSDVVASAAIGMLAAWAVRPTTTLPSTPQS